MTTLRTSHYTRSRIGAPPAPCTGLSHYLPLRGTREHINIYYTESFRGAALVCARRTQALEYPLVPGHLVAVVTTRVLSLFTEEREWS